MTRARGLAGFASAISGPVNSNDLNVGVLTATNVTVDGTITYEDVSNVDSVGIITAQAGIRVSSGSVGIGTNDPTGKLEIVGNNSVQIIQYGNGTKTGYFVSRTNVNRSNADSAIHMHDFRWNDTAVARIKALTGDDTTNKDNGYLTFETSDTGSVTERMRIDSGGNVGIGEDSPESRLHLRADENDLKSLLNLQNRSTGSSAGSQIAFFNGGVDASDNRLAYIRSFLTGSNGNFLTFGTNANGSPPVERMRITAGGNVGIGTDSPARPLHIESTLNNPVRIKSSATYSRIEFSSATSTDPQNVAIGAFGDNFRIFTGTGGSNATRMEVSSSGNVIFGDATPTQMVAGTNSGKFYQGSDSNFISCRATTANSTHQSFINANGEVGKITTSGSNTTYATQSDYRLKENVVDLDGAIDRVKQLAPRRFNFIADADTTVDGFLAHEAQAVVPEAVTGSKDEVDGDGNAVIQGIDQSKLVPLLTAALQEAIAEIETLKTKVAALEGN